MSRQTTANTEHHPPPLVVVMGVSGSGKTTVGAALAQRLRVPFADADDFHPQANIDKMSAGTPLTDLDRGPWLATIAGWLADHASTGGVTSCSALKQAYRDILAAAAPHVYFLHLHGDPEVIAARVAGRLGHFMPAALVESQFATLEPLGPTEHGAVIEVDQPVDDLVTQSLHLLTSRTPEVTQP
ncbi:gluconokinase [Intrasporangium flavum]|uniref:gluconokinase n=1 Tax=Intrasporangium flavum TaxID=1428657 RepID=UPI00096E3EC6|nr:gluconokinase [Intrasporangium flavum]